jgi:hypothetical protein
MTLPVKYNHQTSRPIYDVEETIETLAELAGFKVYEILDENSNFVGYTLQPIDKELDHFINAEIATEEHEAEIVGAMGSFLGDDY